MGDWTGVSWPECNKRADMDHDSEEFQLRWGGGGGGGGGMRQGSSPAMEPEGALRLF